MKEAIVKENLDVEIVDSAIPEPGPDQLVIQVVVSGSNPKDWYVCLCPLHVLFSGYNPHLFFASHPYPRFISLPQFGLNSASFLSSFYTDKI
jgi:hypothetical protein